jgi:TPP-dependent pyruvate/acetoin dehydrogenase alpha subunit
MIEFRGRVCLNETAPQENPLINNKKLRQLYLAMVEARILAEHIARLQRGVKAGRLLDPTHGQEACRVSTAIDLGPGDLVSDAQQGVVMDLVLGAEVGSVLKRVAAPGERSRTAEIGARSRELPWIEDVDDRLRMALGAALAFKTLKQANLVVAYVRHRDAGGGSWRRTLTLAAKLELPAIFVVLPEVAGKKKKHAGLGHVSAKARSCGVPGIPVDSSDAVALYRVAQESIGRIRGGGGPVVIDCVVDRTQGKTLDPIVQMNRFLLEKKVCTPAWLDHAGDAFRERIAAIAK